MLQFPNHTTKANKITTVMLQNYYTNHFDITPLINLIGLSTFQRREFGFQFDNNRFIRNLSFQTPQKLLNFMQKGVSQAFVGAVFKKSPSKTQTIKKTSWESRELIFDIDINEYDPVRTCCQGNIFCPICWTLIQDAMRFIDATLKEDFGFTQTQWIFSGRRGVHGWVLDDVGKTLSKQQRASIVNYITLVNNKDGKPYIDKPLKQIRYTHTLRERIFSTLATSYLRYSSIEELRALGLTTRDIFTLKTYTQKGQINLNPPQLIADNFPSIDSLRFIKAIIIHRYPRIDQKVTTDVTRLLKIPNSISPTGRVCSVIKNIATFNPLDVPTVFDYA